MADNDRAETRVTEAIEDSIMSGEQPVEAQEPTAEQFVDNNRPVPPRPHAGLEQPSPSTQTSTTPLDGRAAAQHQIIRNLASRATSHTHNITPSAPIHRPASVPVMSHPFDVRGVNEAPAADALTGREREYPVVDAVTEVEHAPDHDSSANQDSEPRSEHGAFPRNPFLSEDEDVTDDDEVSEQDELSDEDLDDDISLMAQDILAQRSGVRATNHGLHERDRDQSHLAQLSMASVGLRSPSITARQRQISVAAIGRQLRAVAKSLDADSEDLISVLLNAMGNRQGKLPSDHDQDGLFVHEDDDNDASDEDITGIELETQVANCLCYDTC